MRRFPRTGKKGFTLVEILVVLAVVGVLAALLFGAFSRARENGRNATCQSNLKQIFLASQQYIQDSDSVYASSGSWREVLGSYVSKSRSGANIFVCPSTPQPAQPVGGEAGQADYVYYIGFLMTLDSDRRRLTGTHDAQLQNTAKIFMSSDVAFEGFFRRVEMPHADACGLTLGNGRPDTTQYVSTIHGGGSNILFADGHVKWVTPAGFAQKICEAAPFLQPPFRADGPHLP